MASDALKKEYLAEYVQGMGNEFFLISARSQAEIAERYPLFIVKGLDEKIGVPPEGLETLRMYPGAGRPRDIAVQDRSPEERQRFVHAQQRLWEKVAKGLKAIDFPGHTIVEVSRSQRWIDIDDDADFRMQMHELWKNDPRYLELPPEQRIF